MGLKLDISSRPQDYPVTFASTAVSWLPTSAALLLRLVFIRHLDLLGSHVIMPLRLVCPQCQAAYTVPDELLGKLVRCKECQHLWTAEAIVEEEPVSNLTPVELADEESPPLPHRA